MGVIVACDVAVRVGVRLGVADCKISVGVLDGVTEVEVTVRVLVKVAEAVGVLVGVTLFFIGGFIPAEKLANTNNETMTIIIFLFIGFIHSPFYSFLCTRYIHKWYKKNPASPRHERAHTPRTMNR